jgi:pilus assembly protein CpaE
MRHAAMKDVAGNQPGGAPWMQQGGRHSLHKIIAVYSPKGGVGRSVIAANLAVMLRRGTGRRVALVDANLTSGDAHILLNMTPTSGIEDLRETVGSSDYDQIQGMVAFHEDSGVGLIRSPMSVEVADRYTSEAMKAILVELSDHFDYIVVDTDTTYAPHTLTTLEAANLVVLLTTLEITSVNQVSQFFEIVDRLDNVIPKIQLVCNRADPMYGIQAKHVEARFGRHCLALIPDDPRVVAASVNRGVPFVLSQRNAQVSKAIEKLAKRSVEVLAQSDDAGNPSMRAARAAR